MKVMDAIVFNCEYNGLSVIQELGRHKIKVIALDSVRSIGTFSRYGKYFKCPNPLISEIKFIEFLKKLGTQFIKPPVLFPTNDHWVYAVSKYKNELSEYYLPCVADYNIMELIIKKKKFYEWASINNYPVPKTWSLTSIDMVKDFNFPLVAKPEYRRISSNDSNANNFSIVIDNLRLTIINNKKELNKFITDHLKIINNFIFQEYVTGFSDRMYTVGIYANKKSEVLNMFTGRKIRGYPPDCGDCVFGQNEDVPEYLKNMVKEICKHIKYHGIAEFEFKRDLHSNEFKLIEINPRTWSWIGITPYCNSNLVLTAYLDLNNKKVNVSYAFKKIPSGNIKWIKILKDFQNCLYKNSKLGYSDWNLSLKQWINSIKAEKLVIAEFSLDDPLPFIYAIIYFFFDLMRDLLKFISINNLFRRKKCLK